MHVTPFSLPGAPGLFLDPAGQYLASRVFARHVGYSIAETADGYTGTGPAVRRDSPTINTAAAGGTWTAASTWTLPAFTLGGTVTGGGNQVTGLGNVGLNCTPSAWNSAYRAISLNHTGTSAYGWSGGNLWGLVNGGYLDSAFTWKYAVTGLALIKVEGDDSGNFTVSTAPSGTSGNTITWTQRFKVTSTSAVASVPLTSSSATGGIGYSTGAGGTVAQATSKSTGVTLNTASGQITMNNAALAASTTVSFTLTNSAIAADDVVAVQRKSGGTAAAYQVWCDSTAAGSCVICVRNTTAGSLSEAVVLQFAVIKAVTS